METHANHLHKAPGKKFWHYFFEFLMLFLAVFCGFFAENLRERNVEHHREKQFIASMLKDLEADTAQLHEVLKDTTRIQGIDSLLNILQLPSIKKMDVRAAYKFGKYVSNISSIEFTRNTLTQLKSGGNMRLIRNQNVVDSLNILDNLRNHCDKQLEHNIQMTYTAFSIGYKIFDKSFYKHPDTSASFMTSDIKLIHEYANSISTQQGTYDNYQYMLRDYLAYCDRLIPFIKKEYNL